MKKIILSLSAAAMLLGAPAAQAAFVSYPIEVVSGTASTPATTTVATEAASTEASTVATKVVKAKKLSFFGKLKNFFTGNSGKSQIVAALLCWLVGILGIHRFYLGYTWQGIVQLLTFGGFFGIWVVIDLIRILTGDLQPKDGSYDRTF